MGGNLPESAHRRAIPTCDGNGECSANPPPIRPVSPKTPWVGFPAPLRRFDDRILEPNIPDIMVH
jgi:hypothetical protein